MDIMNMLAELRSERDRIIEAIAVLERIAAGAPRRRGGRLPGWAARAPFRADRSDRRSVAHSARQSELKWLPLREGVGRISEKPRPNALRN